jgi:hypothetical protein
MINHVAIRIQKPRWIREFCSEGRKEVPKRHGWAKSYLPQCENPQIARPELSKVRLRLLGEMTDYPHKTSSLLMLDENLDVTFDRHGTHYSMRISLMPASTFSVILVNDNLPDRWEGQFTSSFVNEMTAKVGRAKRFDIFVKMLHLAATGSSPELSFDILTAAEISTDLDPDENKLYLVLTHMTQFDEIRYPLILLNQPFTTDELKLMIRQYRQDNLALRRELQQTQGHQQMDSIEAQLDEIEPRRSPPRKRPP